MQIPQKGAIFHVAGPMPNGWRVLDIWDAQADFERFQRERLMAAVQKAGLQGEPKVQFFPVHNVFAPGLGTIGSMGKSSLP